LRTIQAKKTKDSPGEKIRKHYLESDGSLRSTSFLKVGILAGCATTMAADIISEDIQQRVMVFLGNPVGQRKVLSTSGGHTNRMVC
jgi:hypothetical protein